MENIRMFEQEIVDSDKLKFDGQNPNRMTKMQRDALAENIRKFGFLVPIVVNKDYLVADGEQRASVAIHELGMKKLPVVRVDVDDIDRRILRQVLNKLRGSHVPMLDSSEYEKIVNDRGLQEFSELLGQDSEYVKDFMDACKESFERFLVLREDKMLENKKTNEEITIVFKPTKEQFEKLNKKLVGRDIKNMVFKFVDGVVV